VRRIATAALLAIACVPTPSLAESPFQGIHIGFEAGRQEFTLAGGPLAASASDSSSFVGLFLGFGQVFWQRLYLGTELAAAVGSAAIPPASPPAPVPC
jgi:hypothetical protein